MAYSDRVRQILSWYPSDNPGVKSNLARFKVPRDVVFLNELPRNPTGKIVKRELS